MTTKYPCPSCGFLVFDEPSGSYDICPICGWEDDHVQLSFPTMHGGANGGSLLEYQDGILKEIPLGIQLHRGYERDPEWRPLTSEDLIDTNQQPKTGLGYFEAALQDSPPYYWKKPVS